MQQKKSLRLFKQSSIPGVKTFVFCVLCAVLMVVDSQSNLLVSVRRGISSGLAPIQKTMLLPRDWVRQVSDWLNAVDMVKLQTNEAERKKIELAQISVQASQMAAENAELRRLLGVKQAVNVPSVAVEILFAATNPLHHTLVLTKGSQDGIAPGMPVIGEGGIVGQVLRVTRSTAEASLITDERISIPAIILRNGLRVVVYGAGLKGKIEIRYIAEGTDIKEGDSVVTSGIGGVFPSGLAIGKVNKIEHNSFQGFTRAYITPSAHPENNLHFLVLLTEPTLIKESFKEQGGKANGS